MKIELSERERILIRDAIMMHREILWSKKPSCSQRINIRRNEREQELRELWVKIINEK